MTTALKPCPFCGGEADLLDTLPSGGCWCRCDECSSDGPSGDTEADAIAAWNRRADLSPALGAVAVKPLVWNDRLGWATAQTAMGQIGVEVTGSRCAYWTAGQDDDESPFGYCDTIDDAKAAAEADYQDSILGALVAPSDADLDRAAIARPKVAALVKAAQDMRDTPYGEIESRLQGRRPSRIGGQP